MICSWLKKSRKKKESYSVGKTFCYGGNVILIVDKRYGELMGHEYMVFLNGEIHGWVTHSVLEDLKPLAME